MVGSKVVRDNRVWYEGQTDRGRRRRGRVLEYYLIGGHGERAHMEKGRKLGGGVGRGAAGLVLFFGRPGGHFGQGIQSAGAGDLWEGRSGMAGRRDSLRQR